MRYFRFLLFILTTGQMAAQQLFLKHHAAAGDVLNEKEQTLYRFEADPLMLSTTNGFYIYDGIGCQRVGRKDQGASSVSTIWKDGETYWIGYEDGGIFQWKQQALTPWTIPEGWPKVRITGFARDSQGQHWTSTYGEGVYVFSHNTLYNIGTDDGLPSQDIYWMVAAGVRGVMVGTDRGLYLCHFRNGKKSIQKIRIHEELDRDIPLKVKKIPGTSLYIVETHESGVWQMNSILLTGKKIAQTEPKNIITPAPKRYYLAKSGRSTSIQEVVGIGNGKQIFTHLKSNLSEDLDISDMLVDEEGLLWLICKNNGLLSAPLAFKTYPTGIQEVQSILQVNQKLWIGTESGLYKADLATGERQKVSPHNVLCIMHLPHRHEIWAGTFGDGVIVMDENGSIKAQYTSQTLLSNDNVFSMVYSGNAIWLASLAGIDVISEDGKRIKQINRKNGLPTDYIYTLFPDTKGTVWVGTDGEGVVAIHSDFKIRKYSLKNTILSFAEDAAGRIWFATLGNGVGILEQGNISMMDQNDGLTDLQISGLTRDRDGNILSIHHSGIDIIDPTSCAVRQTGMQTGIQKWQMKEHAYYMNPEGFLYIPHNAQIIEYNTSDFKIPKPFVNFTSVKLGPLACSTNETIEAAHDQHDLIANFSGVWLEHPESVVFRYILDPVDKTWRYTKDQTIIYADLKPDRYRLTLECAENTHFMDADRKEISFVIQPPYWTRWWFVLAVVAILVGGILTVARSRNRRRREIAAIKTNQVKAELETLKSQINPHFLFNSFNTLISVIETNPKDAVHFVEKLSDFYRHMLQYRDTELITLKEEMEIQENYEYLLKMRFGEGIAFHFQLQAKQNVQIIPLTLQLLSENAIKHNIVSRENPLNIYIQEESDWLVFKNEKRPRMSVEKSTYFGLKTLSARYRAIVGKDIQIRDGAGEFIIKIPLIYT